MNRWLRFTCLFFLLQAACAWGGVAPSANVAGPRKLLVIAVCFKDAAPAVSIQDILKKADKIDRYIQAASYARVSLSPRIAGWYTLPGSLGDYRVSPYNFKVDKQRVRKLLSEALSAARADGANPDDYDLVWVLAGVRTEPGKGYGMIAYCANPGMLSMGRQAVMRMERISLADGGVHCGPVVVSAENAHVGHVAHDLLHALGGARDGNRAVPDLYDFKLQSNPPRGAPMSPELFAVHAGPWGIMSQHFIDRHAPPPPPLAFTRMQLGWISGDRIVELKPGEERRFTLAPLSTGKGVLVGRIRLGATRYLLLENRQPLSSDAVLPGHGLIVSLVDETKAEGGGIVTVMDATPATRTLYDAAYVPGDERRNAFVSERFNTAVLVLSQEDDGGLRILLTTPAKLGGPLP